MVGAMILALATAAVLMTAPGRAHTVHAPQTACTQTEQPEINFLIPNWSQVKWVTDTCGFYIRGVSQCQGGRLTTTVVGGYVISRDLWSRATCPPAEPKIIRAGYDFKTCASCTASRHWYWPTARTLAVRRLAPGCHHAALERTSGAPNVPVVFCLPGQRPTGATRLLVVNDGSDGDFDQGDVILTFWQVPHG